MISACTRPVVNTKPVVSIVSPPNGTHFAAGEVVRLRVAAAASNNVTRIELRDTGNLVAQQNNPDPSPTWSAQLEFVPSQAGAVTLTVNALDATGASSDPASVVVLVGVTAILLSTPTPAGTAPQPQATAAATQSTGCTLASTFITDVNVPDYTVMAPGAPFTKTWRIRNNSACTWDAGYALAFVEGAQMGAPSSVPVPPTARDATFEASVPFIAPAAAGTYTSTWRMRTPNGAGPNEGIFGNRVYVVIRVNAP